METVPPFGWYAFVRVMAVNVLVRVMAVNVLVRVMVVNSSNVAEAATLLVSH